MFRILCDPSSGSTELYLTEIRSGSLMFVVCLVSVWQRNFLTSGVCLLYDGLGTTEINLAHVWSCVSLVNGIFLHILSPMLMVAW